MSMMSGAPLQTEAGGQMAPVILPMGTAKSGLAEKSAVNDGSTVAARRLSRVKKYAFPAIPPGDEESSIKKTPTAIWPKCDCTETLQAGMMLAEAICRQLAPNRPAVLALTSPGDGDGKTQVLSVLAPELARRMPQGVLVVDADFRKADLTSLLTLAAGRTPGEALLTYPTDHAGLSVLPMPPGFEWQYFDAAWVEQIRETWPLVILDMASLEHAETVSLLGHCDGVCLVVRLGHTSRRAVAEAGRVVSACGGKLMGSVVVE
jgi:Mrp family chromosome partitioning ATPase